MRFTPASFGAFRSAPYPSRGGRGAIPVDGSRQARHALKRDALVSLDLRRYVYPIRISQGGQAIPSSTVFTSNRTQAVRLPKAVAFPDDVRQVDVLKIGRSRVIVPQGKRWDDLFLNGPRVSDDFMSEREQPQPEEREAF